MSNTQNRYILIIWTIFSLVLTFTNAQFGMDDGGYQEEGYGPGSGPINGPGPIDSQQGSSQDNNLIYEAKGRLVCGLNGITKVRVVLWDRYRGRDNFIYDETETDIIGNFQVRATKSSYDSQSIAPFLTIYHDCDDEATPGLRKMTVQLPSQYTNRGPIVLKSFDIGTWNLETSFAGEELDLGNQNNGAGTPPIGGYGQGSRGMFGGDRRSWNHGGRRDRDRDYDGVIQV